MPRIYKEYTETKRDQGRQQQNYKWALNLNKEFSNQEIKMAKMYL